MAQKTLLVLETPRSFMVEKSREEQFWAMFEDAGITPIVIDPNNPESVEQGGNEIAQRIQDAVSEIQSQDKPKA
jgi:hypothetical protein